MKKLSVRTWMSFIMIGLAGQLAWSIENMYLNVYLYNEITPDSGAIASMVAASAVTATLTTLFIGMISDRIGKRKVFITAGYILWGFSTMAFSYVKPSHFRSAAAAASALIFLDCIMTFFGSAANDAAFNAYVTDVTDAGNRGRAEAVLATFPLLSMLFVFGLFDGLTKQGRWNDFFMIFGLINIATGIASAFLIKESPVISRQDGNVLSGLLRLFCPEEISKNRIRYLDLVSVLLLSVSLQVFLPYLIIYISEYLGYGDFALMLAIVLLGSSVISVLSGKVQDTVGKSRIGACGAVLMTSGLVMLYFARSYLFVTFSALLMMSGYLITASAAGANLRDTTPVEIAGSFQGVRMIASVALPMIIGPWIGSSVIKGSGRTYSELGVTKDVPTPQMFIPAAIIMIPLIIIMIIRDRKEKN
ncbi:MAG: MFS transporter [Bullifex sp.]